MDLTDIPVDVLNIITGRFLDPKDYLSLASASKNLNRICNQLVVSKYVNYHNIRNVRNKHVFKNLGLDDELNVEGVSPKHLHIDGYNMSSSKERISVTIPISVEKLYLSHIALEIELTKNMEMRSLHFYSLDSVMIGKLPKSIRKLSTDNLELIAKNIDIVKNLVSFKLSLLDYLIKNDRGEFYQIERIIHDMPKLESLELEVGTYHVYLADMVGPLGNQRINLPDVKSIRLTLPHCKKSILDFGNSTKLQRLEIGSIGHPIEIINPPTNLKTYNISLNNFYDDETDYWNNSLNLSAIDVDVSGIEKQKYICDNRVKRINLNDGSDGILSDSVEICGIISNGLPSELLDPKNMKCLHICASSIKVCLGKTKFAILVSDSAVELIGSCSCIEKLIISAEKIIGDLSNAKITEIDIMEGADLTEFSYNGKINWFKKRLPLHTSQHLFKKSIPLYI